MLNRDYISMEVERLLSIIDAEEMPEAYRYLAGIVDNEGFVTAAPYEIVSTLSNCDRQNDMPDEIADFIRDIFDTAIADGSCDAMNDLGAQYYTGSRCYEQSFEKAMYYYKMAAENGSRQAQENLGYCYYYGRNMDKPDYEKAFHYFALGAFDGHLISLYKIGDMYLNGYYVKKNEREAFHIYMHCLNTMSDESARLVAGPVHLRLGNMFLKGIGVEQNYKNALICYQKAEGFLFDMVANGGAMYKKSLDIAIAGQAMARKKLLGELPEDEWSFD